MEPKVIKLEEPLINEGQTVSEVTIYGLKAKHLRTVPAELFDGTAKNPAAFIPIVASVTGLPEAVVDEMSLVDLVDIIGVISDFMAVSQKTG